MWVMLSPREERAGEGRANNFEVIVFFMTPLLPHGSWCYCNSLTQTLTHYEALLLGIVRNTHSASLTIRNHLDFVCLRTTGETPTLEIRTITSPFIVIRSSLKS